MLDYTELEAWKQGRQVVKTVYEVTAAFPHYEFEGLTAQIRQSSITIPTTIAEAMARTSRQDQITFLQAALGSIYKLETQLYIALDVHYITKDKLLRVIKETMSCKRLILLFIRHLENHQNHQQLT